MTAPPRMDPLTLARLLGVDLTATNGESPRSTPGATAAEPVDLTLYPLVQAALDKNTGDRSADTMRVLGACFDDGLTYAPACWVVNTRADLAGRLADRDDDDLQRCWNKVVDSRQNIKWTTNLGATSSHQTSDNTSEVAFTDKGNAMRLAAAAAKHLRYVPELNRWIHWNGICWHIDADTGAIDTAAGYIAMNLPAETK
jgi:hypothetical protein